MCEASELSQCRACRLAGLSLSTCRYEYQRQASDAQLSVRIIELTFESRRFSYRRNLYHHRFLYPLSATPRFLNLFSPNVLNIVPLFGSKVAIIV